MFADWSCTVLVHNRTCSGKYRIFKLSIDLCISFISGPGLSDGGGGALCYVLVLWIEPNNLVLVQ